MPQLGYMVNSKNPLLPSLDLRERTNAQFRGKCNWEIFNPHLPFCLLGDGELVEQVLGQQTAENRESLLDNLIRQLQNEQDERHNAAQQAEEAEGMKIIPISMDFFTKYLCYLNKPFYS